ncbi:tetratricopeptide repeat protein [Thermophagus sp. OGC60D27]|uniref:tetratricopeptide repeat protein n=1 Tax=Thermophagus sp. OGC60D27 TaxID=3458415 RepID=UPI004037B5B6
MAKKQQHEDSFENVESALTKTEQFIEDNQKLISIAAIALIVIVGGYWAFKKLYIQPLQKEAQESIFHAQQYFETDSFNLALNGDGMNPGFLEIIDKYSSTDVGELSQYYAGICFLHLGNLENAIQYLKDFSTDEPLLQATAQGAIGDAYLESGNRENAIDWYKKATSSLENEMITPFYLFKLGLLYEEMGDKEKALEAYNTIKKNYQESSEGRQIDKYITRVKISG